MSSTNLDTVTGEPQQSGSPGRLVAAAREGASLSPADLAVRLRLDTRIIQALERDDFDVLPAPTFVKGYIRSIAKELEIDSQPILDAYGAHAVVEPPLADFASRPPEQIGINSTVMKLVTYGLIATLFILLGLWWRSNYRGLDVIESRDPVATTPVQSAATPLPYQFDIVEHDSDSWRSPAPPPDADATMDAGEDGELAAEAADAAAEGGLRLVTESEAWVEIYDENDKQLYYGTATSAKPVEIAGRARYRLIIGNADSVNLQYEGETIDLAPHARLGIARLELGDEVAETDPVAEQP